ncbi:MAG: tetratricopeptide repeat protein [Mucilaginibacter sp.]
MKKFCTALVCLMLTLSIHAQQRITDSLKHLLVTAKEDTDKANVLLQFGRYWTNSKPDSAMLMNQQGLELSRKLNYLKGEASGLNLEGIVYQATGNYPKALSYFLAALKINEKRNDSLGMAKNLGNIANLYAAESDYRQSIDFMLKAKRIAEGIHNKQVVLITMVNLAAFYELLNKLDSARTYTTQAYQIAARYKNVESMGDCSYTMGNIYAKTKQMPLALGYYRKAASYYEQAQNDLAMCGTLHSMAELFNKTGQADSSLYYGRKSFRIARRGGFTSSVLDASRFLTNYFEAKGKIDSAFFYQKISIAAKDSLFSQEKTKEVQNLSFAERQRQQEIKEQKRLEDEANKKNLQLAGIAIFLPTFFFFVLFLSRRRIKARMVDFLGVLLLLLTFEFISMLIRPYIAQIQHWVHDAPAIAMFINIGLASLLVPVHRPIERWVKGKLAHRPAINHQPA